MKTLKKVLFSLFILAVLSFIVACSESEVTFDSTKKSVDVKNQKADIESHKKSESKKDSDKESKVKYLVSQMAMYYEEEVGVEKPFTTRIIANSKFMRIDEGTNASSYVLFDRIEKVVYSVVHENATIMMILPKPVPGSLPSHLSAKSVRVVEQKRPKINGQETIEIRQTVNKKSCVSYVLVPNTLDHVVKSMKEYRSVMAGQHWLNLKKTPKDMQDPCFTSFDIYKHSEHLDYGLIVREWNNKKKKQLVDYKQDVRVKSSLFNVPDNYKRFKASL